MTSQIRALLGKLEQGIYKFVRDDGVLDAEDHDIKVYKANTMLSLAQDIQNQDGANRPYMRDVIKQFKYIVELLEMGDPEFESEQQIRDLLRNIRSGIKGLQLSVELSYLGSDEDIPEYVDEAYEPFVDQETGEYEYPTDLSFHSDVLWSYKVNKLNHDKSPEYVDAVERLSTQMQNCSLKLKTDFQVDLGDGLKGVANPRIALQTELQEMCKATKRYFEPTHLAKTAEVARVSQAFYEEQNVITDLCAGSLIIAACEALRSLHLLNDNLEQHEAKLTWQGVDLSLQRRPSVKNLGNLFIRNVGCYGHREEGKKAKFNILDDFEKITAYSGKDHLKQVISRFGANPSQITGQMLKLPDNMKGHELLTKLKQNLFLIFCAEIFRYFPVEESTTHSVKKIPFSVALSMGLEMLYLGEIELEELFDHDAELGLPTGTKILDNPDDISKKLLQLIKRYQSYLQDSYQSVEQFKKVFPQGAVVSSDSQHVDRLQTYFGRHLK